MIKEEDIRKKIGLPTKEAKIYTCLLKMGSGFASVVAAEAGLKRSTAYQILENLHKKGLVLKFIKGKKFFYSPAEPKNVVEYLEEKEKRAQKQKKDFEEFLPEINLFYSNRQNKPNLKFFDKKEEVISLLLSSVELQESDELLGFISLDLMTNNLEISFLKKLAKTIKESHKQIRFINYDDSSKIKEKTKMFLAKYFRNTDNKPLIKTQPSKHDLNSLILVSDHKTFIIDINPPEFMGMVIKNKDLSLSFKMMFNALWKTIK